MSKKSSTFAADLSANVFDRDFWQVLYDQLPMNSPRS